MNSQAIQVHKGWFVPASLVLLVTCAIDGIVAWLVPQPLRWCMGIGATLPLSLYFLVLLPLLKQESDTDL